MILLLMHWKRARKFLRWKLSLIIYCMKNGNLEIVKERQRQIGKECWSLKTNQIGNKEYDVTTVHKRKIKADGSVERYKARLVAQGFSQSWGWARLQ